MNKSYCCMYIQESPDISNDIRQSIIKFTDDRGYAPEYVEIQSGVKVQDISIEVRESSTVPPKHWKLYPVVMHREPVIAPERRSVT